jgi:hypothetical protein
MILLMIITILSEFNNKISFNNAVIYDKNIQVSNQRVQERLKLEVQRWDVHSYSFTMEGGLNPELDRLIKDVVVIRLLVLTQDGREVAHIRNVRFKGSQSRFRTPRVQTPVETPPIQFTHYYYEQLDGWL